MTLEGHFSRGRMGSHTIEMEATLAAPSMVDFHPKMPSLLLELDVLPVDWREHDPDLSSCPR